MTIQELIEKAVAAFHPDYIDDARRNDAPTNIAPRGEEKNDGKEKE